MNRRNFLKITSPLALAPIAINGFTARAFAPNALLNALSGACDGIENRILVLVQIKGGNDGLNTIVPLNQYDTYAQLRPTIKLPEKGTNGLIALDNTLPLADQVGLHPALTSFKNMYDSGQMHIVQGVGYEQINKSHFKATDLWLTGGDGTPENYNINSGWMGRYLAYTYPGVAGNPSTQMPDPLGIQLGDPKPSLGFHSEAEHATSINLSGQDPAGFYSLISTIGGQPISNMPNSDYGDQLQYISDVEKNVSVYAERISAVFNAGQNLGTYPGETFAAQLKTVARLISGGCKTKIYLVQLGGFDTHNSQVDTADTTIGTHAELLTRLSQGIEAFYADLALLKLADQVATVTFSEFGRKAAENGNFGTDHGTLAPMFIFGNALQAGVSGTNVNLSDLENGEQLKNPQHDYRQVFTTILQDWLGASGSCLTATMFEEYQTQKLNILQSSTVVDPDCYIDTIATSIDLPNNTAIGAAQMTVYPNPAQNIAWLQLSSAINTEAQLNICNMAGQVVQKRALSLQAGANLLPIGLNRVAAGNYIIQVLTNDGQIAQKTQLVVVK
ncbi:MAG: DUF1501 domain-containing protein [Sphingobacteriales bacterium]|jgi:uncharacterized protein (DUF1501 family)|nr:DUF1501 domain-containing protein [Sphingobacteriales bacterium]MBP9140958.1 DUF1501 domain-containing protein [Chitinophagales bacterium]MDA0198749.1 DUF1501 domain-containing protein [Bacteroidota bacterium]MBK7528129.1 DUF1501 domain-containing protein [Sphingobacteriales bacterium]MBL0246141.1 DUF1501 domain-containing protein [Sphingobacteriales bacterium]